MCEREGVGFADGVIRLMVKSVYSGAELLIVIPPLLRYGLSVKLNSLREVLCRSIRFLTRRAVFLVHMKQISQSKQ